MELDYLAHVKEKLYSESKWTNVLIDSLTYLYSASKGKTCLTYNEIERFFKNHLLDETFFPRKIIESLISINKADLWFIDEIFEVGFKTSIISIYFNEILAKNPK